MIRRLYLFGLLTVCIGYAGFLAWQERDFRAGLAVPPQAGAPVAPAAQPASPDPTAIATVLGLAAQTPLQPSAEPLTLLASFVAANGLSKALLADAQGARIYQVGDPLPGGSTLRRVEANRAVLWNKGREEVLTLQASAVRFLNRQGTANPVPTPAPSTRYLRPHTGQSE